ncbi:hypothetical protein [Actinomycetospora soli]|uniref:hypothetical protein n=1 Tax=Actinomycetospora soli TaxID=2893887 RepID=UPI001E417124|nr:hypothetical protein [Actinomycetospora soli]MCD2188536.1 hypothetical protein [Actinomycetospora soli]
MDQHPSESLVRSASVAWRRVVDEAVGPRYDTAFLRLDLLLTTPESRCDCPDCLLEVDRRLGAILASLPRP